MSSLFYKLIFVNALISVLVARFYYSSDDDRKIYIVYMGSKPEDTDSAHLHHKGMLKEVVGRNFAPEYVICTYHKSFNGFAVKLTEKEAQKIADKEGVVSVFEDEKHEVETTKSWDFLGFPRNVPRLPQEESEIIVGVFDTGISPDSASFNDKGFGPPPDKWKGICQTLAGFHCNKKIIGARVYMKDGPLLPGEVMSPIDTDGHGTHVASIVAGGLVDHANLEGLAEGMARGGVPSARIAVYKVCWSDGCATHQVLRAFDDAIDDGVDIISYSIGAKVQKPYFQDPFTIGAFHAMKKGVLTSKSAGNNGHKYSTVTGIAPWVLSVAATTTNRNFVTDVRLGNNHAYQGYTVNTFDLKGKQYSLIYGGDAPNPTSTKSDSSVCKENSVNVEMVKGKILVCDSLQYASTFKYLINGPVGVLMQDNRPKNDGRSYPMAASHLSRDRGGTEIEEYMSSTKNPTATILKSNTVYDGTVKVVHFSSRGPNTITKNIIKPDLAAPGVQILAAWSPTAPVSQVEGDPRRTLYNIISGTSMACPHASAAAMYVKTFHPTWSPAAIKSALMTTAKPMGSSNKELELAYGSGLLNPLEANNPRLVYDASVEHYVNFLCGQGYTTKMLRAITNDDSVCTPGSSISVFDLNYPSFALSVDPSNLNVNQDFKRTLTSVAMKPYTYSARVYPEIPGLAISVNPILLSFHGVGDTGEFTLRIRGTANLGKGQNQSQAISTSLEWSDFGAIPHKVRSPILIYLSNISN